MDLTEKILFYMKRYHMIPENKNIVVGLSGGADSVCLLYVLVALRKKLGLQLCAVHVHHGLRGVEADADEAYVRDICRAWDVPLKSMRIEAALLAKQWGIGCEEAGRRARYEILKSAYRRWAIVTVQLRWRIIGTTARRRFCFTCSAALVWTEWQGFARCERRNGKA